ncbi:MAG TPA: hypothetical protein VHW44_26225 [Pseudonocardiaceae bacterium]|jgi:hypothetical protein|nr:hypothetical protein [Pseudonocardiaceae bacterium]
MTEAELRAAAFGDRPEADVSAAARDGGPRERWLAAVTLGARGRYAAAAGLLRPLVAGADPLLAALAGATLAAHRRQLGAHGPARRFDAAALGRLAALGPPPDVTLRVQKPDPDGVDLSGAWSDALLGLAADAVGVGHVAEARRLHAAAERVIGYPEGGGTDRGAQWGWRPRIRTEWVAAEIELAAGRPDRAVPHAERAHDVASVTPSIRHRVKSAVVLSAALVADDTPVGRLRAEALLRGAQALSLGRGIFSLAWPAALVLADLVPAESGKQSKIVSEALTCCFLGSEAEMQRLATASPWIPTALLRSGDTPRRSGELAS